MKLLKKYLITLFVTILLFFIAWQISGVFTKRKVLNIENAQNEIATTILENEHQLSLSDAALCVKDDTLKTLGDQIGDLAGKIAFSEEQSAQKETILELKKQYTILQVKDFLINKQKAERCDTPLSTILFFYETKEKCPDCIKQSYVLDAIRATYGEVRVYSFDYTLELSTIEALKASYAVEGGLPVLVIDGKTTYGFQSLEALQRLLLSSKKAF